MDINLVFCVHVHVGNLKGFLFILMQGFFLCVVLGEFMPTGSSSDDIRSCREGAFLGGCYMNVWIFSCHAIKAVDNKQQFYMLKKLERNISWKPFIG